MNILITGGSGFLGSEITNLLSKNNNIYIYDIIFQNVLKNIILILYFT